MARAKKESVMVERDNRQSLKDFQNAIETAVMAHSRYALNATRREMMLEAIRQATYSNYSGTLVRSYMAAMVTPKKIKPYHPESAPARRITKGNGITEIYNKSADIIRRTETDFTHWNTDPSGILVNGRNQTILPSSTFNTSILGGRFHHAKDIGGGRFLKKLTYARSHDEPKYFKSEYDTREGRYIKRYTRKEHFLSNMHGAVNADYVVLTNGAPYAEEVHRKWNRVLPGELPAYTKNFYLKRLTKTIREMAKKQTVKR